MSEMSAFECYKEYMALKNHFTKPSYDYFKYNGKTRVSFNSFETRKDKLYFMKVAKHPDPLKYILSNLIHNPKLWIKDIAYSPEAEKTYTEWQKRQQSLTYLFKEQLSKLNEQFDSNFAANDNIHPYVLKLYLQKEISLETLVILTDLTGCLKHWERKYPYDPVVLDVLTLIQKYRPFLKYDKDAFKNIVIDKFADKGYTK